MAHRNLYGFLPLVVASIGVLVGYLIYARELIGLCADRAHAGCLFGNDIARTVGEPLLIYSLLALPVGFLYLFARSAQKSILIFSIFWLPLSAVLIAITPSTSNTWMPLYFIGKDMITWILAILFVIISLILIALKSLRKNS